MKTLRLIKQIENTQLKTNLPKVQVGDLVRIGVIIQEGNKQRVQQYEGTILSKMNTGINTTINVRRIFQGIAIERIFLIHSPVIDGIQVIQNSKIRRSKLFYLRNKIGKNARLVQKICK